MADGKRTNKKKSKKVIGETVWSDDHVSWKVVAGKLVPPPGRPFRIKSLFKYVGEKLPFGCISEVQRRLRQQLGYTPEGIYMAHDSMGVARYGGRGRIFSRLRSHRRKHFKELLYFSFYLIQNKQHERELETAILRAAGPQMILNNRKVRSNIDPGSIRDYEPGTQFFERQHKKGKKKKIQRRRSTRASSIR
jgi:hypothetical protein